MLPGPEGQWAIAARGTGQDSRLRGRRREEPGAGAEDHGVELGYGPGKPLKVKVSVRNISIYRDPAVILIDQLKKIYIDGELEPIDTTVWYAKVQRKDYPVSLNLTGVAVDDPDVNLIENYTCKSERNYTQYCNPEVDALIFQQSKEVDRGEAQASWCGKSSASSHWMWRGPSSSTTAPRPAGIPHVKGVVLHQNSIYDNWRLEDVWLDK